MNQKRVQKFRKVLERHREEVKRILSAEWSAVTERDGGTFGNPVEEAQYAITADIAVVTGEETSRRLADIEQSLRDLEEGTYGQCGGCEEPIPEERLEALPTARRCILCQEKVEKQMPRWQRNRPFGDESLALA